MSKNEKSDYTLTLEGAAQLLGKSERTVQRYVKSKKLSQKYVMGPKGKELRFSKQKVLSLARDMSSGIGASASDRHDKSSQTKAGTEQVNLNIMDLLKRHEQAMYRLGQLEEKSRQVVAIEERAQSLAQRNDELAEKDAKQRQQMAALEAKLTSLEREKKRPLSLWERLSGYRRS